MRPAGSQEFMNKIWAHKGSMNNGNIILRCINAQPTTGYSHRELVLLISDGPSAMVSHCMCSANKGGNPTPPSITED